MWVQYRDNEMELLPEFEAMLNESYYAAGARNGEYPAYEFEAPAGIAKPKSIWLNNTDLQAPYFGGNFNFLYNGGANEATITFNTYLSFRKKYTNQVKNDFIARLDNAVKVWDNAAQVQIRDNSGNYNNRINLRFKLNLVNSPNNSNKVTDIHPNNTWSSWFNGKNREIVMREMNVFIGTSRNVFVHELGHVWGLLDEYDTKWIEMKFSPGHVGSGSPLIKDTKAIMNLGYQDEVSDSGEFRTRYFTHFGKAIAAAFWNLPDYVSPNRFNGKAVSRTIYGRIALLKKDIAGSPALTADALPFNPQFTNFQLSKR